MFCHDQQKPAFGIRQASLLINVTNRGLCFLQVILLPGRHMEYSVPGANAADEEGFVTLIRYSAPHPDGKATAVFSWKSGTMEVRTCVVVYVFGKRQLLLGLDLAGSLFFPHVLSLDDL